MEDQNPDSDGPVGRRVFWFPNNPVQPEVRVNAIAVGAITMQQNGPDLFQVTLHTHSGEYSTGNMTEAQAQAFLKKWVQRVENAKY